MYIDPNSGGMLFQVLAVVFGFFSAILLFFSGRIRLTIAKLRRQMRERNRPETQKTVSENEPPTSAN
jgi:hypothetical protein